MLLRAVADGLEWSYVWSEPAVQRLRFVLGFDYATGLRASSAKELSSKFGIPATSATRLQPIGCVQALPWRGCP